MHECCAKKEDAANAEKPNEKPDENAEGNAGGETEGKSWLVIALVAILAMVLLYNETQLLGLGSAVAALAKSGAVLSATQQGTGQGVLATGSAGTTTLSGIDVLPKGVPAVYGSELGVSYDDISATDTARANQAINKLGAFDTGLQLSGDKLSRYISIASQISCEYCCGAPSIIFSNGQAACGCAHSGAMRGLAKYLLVNHPDMSDGQILEEMGKWKTLFFPGPMAKKAAIMNEKGLAMNYINLASNKYRDIESGASVTGGTAQVGGC